MLCFKALWPVIGARPSFVVPFSGLLSIAICVSNSEIFAALITFRFEAEVASVIPLNGGANLPFDIAPGDSIVTTFTFEPANGGPDFPQSGALRFELSGHVVNVLGYTIAVLDEYAPNGAPLMGRIADPTNTPVEDQAPGSSDNISLGCPAPSQGISGFCGSLAGHSVSILPVIRFSTDGDPLENNNLIADANIWNQFSFREMSLSFSNSANDRGQMYIGAYIGAVVQVPEPGTLSIALGAATWIILPMFRALRNV